MYPKGDQGEAEMGLYGTANPLSEAFGETGLFVWKLRGEEAVEYEDVDYQAGKKISRTQSGCCDLREQQIGAEYLLVNDLCSVVGGWI